MDFDEFFETMLLKGQSLRTMATMLQVSLSAFLRYINKNPHLEKIRSDIIKKWPEMLREVAVEAAMNGNTTMQIYLNKTIGGLGDGAQKPNDEPQEPRVPAMTREEAKKLVETMRNAKAKELRAIS